MFTRTISTAVAALALGALGVVAQTVSDPVYRDTVRNCVGTVEPIGIEKVYRWEYDDTSYFNVTYRYDPTYCDSTMTVNYINLIDYANGGSYPCTRQQFAATRNTVYSECRVFDQ